MIGRALFRLPLRSRLARPTNVLVRHDCVARTPLVLNARNYATPGRPKKVVGEPSRPVKRAVKKAAAKPASGDSPAEKQVRSKRRSATSKKTNAKNTLTPEARAAKEEKAAATKARAKARADKTKLADLKKAALRPPKEYASRSAYTTFMTQGLKDRRAGENVNEKMKDLARQYKNLTAADIEHYNHLANQQKAHDHAEYQRWVASHSLEEILRANNARVQLRKKHRSDGNKKGTQKWTPIKDERLVKRPATAFALFMTNRTASGDFRNLSNSDRMKLIGQEWKTLNEDEKKKYFNLVDQDKARYSAEHKNVYGFAPPNGAAVAAAAA